MWLSNAQVATLLFALTAASFGLLALTLLGAPRARSERNAMATSGRATARPVSTRWRVKLSKRNGAPRNAATPSASAA